MAARAESLDPADLDVVVTPMRRRHLRGVLRIEHRVYPRPWSLSLFLSELALRRSLGVTLLVVGAVFVVEVIVR